MARYIRKERLQSAVNSLSEWRTATQSQASAHLFPLLSLLAKGVTSSEFVNYEEQDDFDFFNQYFRIDDDEEQPYFDPLTRLRRIASHPHSNVATARKKTFERSWQAAESKVEGDLTYWMLADNCTDKFVQKVMTRGGEITRASVVDLSVWLFRKNAFDDDAEARSLEELFRESFPLNDEQYNKLFVFNDEATEHIFGASPLTDDEILDVVASCQVSKAIPSRCSLESPENTSNLVEDDPILSEVRSVMELGTSGIILRGCPGTGKTWYSWNLALELTENKLGNITRVQFHPSYGYEDFVEGYRPSENSKSGFEIVGRSFLDAVEKATKSDELFVFLIDEVNRGDPARVFGELLTYIEEGWRDVAFRLPFSGKEVSVPRNLLVIATMNQHDRSITPLDMAMLRRFDHIDIHPSGERVEEFLLNAGMSPEHVGLVVKWFDNMQSILPFGIGHTYFLNVADVAKLSTVWRYRILPFCESVLEFEQDRLRDVNRSFNSLHQKMLGQNTTGEE